MFYKQLKYINLKVICLCIYMHVCIPIIVCVRRVPCVCVCKRKNVLMHAQARGPPRCHSSGTVYLCLLRQDLALSRLGYYEVTRIHLSPLPQTWNYKQKPSQVQHLKVILFYIFSVLTVTCYISPGVELPTCKCNKSFGFWSISDFKFPHKEHIIFNVMA